MSRRFDVVVQGLLDQRQGQFQGQSRRFVDSATTYQNVDLTALSMPES